MEKVAVSEFKAKCTELLARVCKTRKSLMVTRHGKPLAEINPPRTLQDRASWIASMQGSGETLADIISPATPADDWEVLRD